MNQKILNIGVIGAGLMGQNHIRVFSQLDNTNLVAIADTNRETLNKVANHYKFKSYTNYKEMLAKEQLDVVSVVVPAKLHYKICKEVLIHGINCIVEKPFTTDLKQAQELIRFSKKKKVLLGVGHIERFNPAITELKKLLTQNKLGKIFQISIRRIGPFPERVRDIGVYLDLFTHDIDIMCYLTESEIRNTHSESARLVHNEHEDLAVGVLKFTNGTIGVLVENWLSPTKVRDIIINGEKGMLLADLITQDVYFYENNYSPTPWGTLKNFRGMVEGDMIRFHIKRDEPLKLELESFANSVINNTPFLVTAEDGLRAVKIALSLKRKG